VIASTIQRFNEARVDSREGVRIENVIDYLSMVSHYSHRSAAAS
jgi:hypothetical protein